MPAPLLLQRLAHPAAAIVASTRRAAAATTV
jgi:hypothetical protein